MISLVPILGKLELDSCKYPVQDPQEPSLCATLKTNSAKTSCIWLSSLFARQFVYKWMEATDIWHSGQIPEEYPISWEFHSWTGNKWDFFIMKVIKFYQSMSKSACVSLWRLLKHMLLFHLQVVLKVMMTISWLAFLSINTAKWQAMSWLLMARNG